MFTYLEGVFRSCDCCRSDICYSQLAYIFVRSEERVAVENRRIMFDVNNEELLLTLCAHCGSRINFDAISEHLKYYGDTFVAGDKRRFGKAHRHGLILNTCDKCDEPLDLDDIQISVLCDTGRVYCEEPGHAMPDIFIEKTERIFLYCQSCGNDLSYPQLKEQMVLQTVKNKFNQRVALSNVSANPGYPANKQ